MQLYPKTRRDYVRALWRVPLFVLLGLPLIYFYWFQIRGASGGSLCLAPGVSLVIVPRDIPEGEAQAAIAHEAAHLSQFHREGCWNINRSRWRLERNAQILRHETEAFCVWAVFRHLQGAHYQPAVETAVQALQTQYGLTDMHPESIRRYVSGQCAQTLRLVQTRLNELPVPP